MPTERRLNVHYCFCLYFMNNRLFSGRFRAIQPISVSKNRPFSISFPDWLRSRLEGSFATFSANWIFSLSFEYFSSMFRIQIVWKTLTYTFLEVIVSRVHFSIPRKGTSILSPWSCNGQTNKCSQVIQQHLSTLLRAFSWRGHLMRATLRSAYSLLRRMHSQSPRTASRSWHTHILRFGESAQSIFMNYLWMLRCDPFSSPPYWANVRGISLIDGSQTTIEVWPHISHSHSRSQG